MSLLKQPMTDNLYFDATVKCRVNHQPNTFMRIHYLKKSSSLLALILAFCSAHFSAIAQISVGASGSTTNTFDTIPAATTWSTVGIGVDHEYATEAAMDAAVQTKTVSSISYQVNSNTGNPPGTLTNAQWSSSGFYLQTRPTGNGATLLMATLHNDSGSSVIGISLNYILTVAVAPGTELIPGYRIYYSLSGAANSWVPVGDFATPGPTSIPLNLSATPWAAGTSMYILFADHDTANNPDGAYQIDNFAITYPKPVITVQPQPGSVSPGSPFTFSVTASGANPLLYQWRKNSNAITSFTTSSNFTILNAQQTDSGFYSVIVSNAFGTATSVDAFLTVQCTAPAGFAAQPVNQTLNSGGTINLSVTASGTAPFTYQWYRNGSPLVNATNSTFTKANAQASDSGQYSVIINNCFDSPITSASAIVSISDATYVLMGLTNSVWKYEESNTDLGTAWRTTNYNDSAWKTGRGILAIETAAAIIPLTNTVLTLQANGTDIPTHYFRNTFVLTNDLSLVSIVSSNYFDDGCVVYLNGVEAFRVNMGAIGSAVGFNTLASATDPPGGEGTFYTTNLPSSLLVQGTNLVAVEVHQVNLTSSDTDWGMEIRVQYLPPALLTITNQPQSLLVEESHPATFTVGVQGQPVYYKWYKDGVVIPNATANPFTIPSISTNEAGNYFVVASNSINSVTSSIATLSVFRDTNGPTLVDADGTLSNNAVLVSFSENVLASTATNVANYKITNTLGGTLAVSSAGILNGTNVLLITSGARVAGNNYIVIVNNVRDISQLQNVIAPNSMVPVRSFLSLIAFNAASKFYDPFPPFDEPNLGTAWKEFTYDTSNWGDGNGVYFNGQDESVVPGPVGTLLSQSPSFTSYFRNSFNLQASPGGLHLLLTHIVDDGAIFYLNGTEIYRFNMPAGAVDYLTPSSTTINAITRVGPVDLLSSTLRSGANVLAIELHQTASGDVDKVFGAQLDASVQSYIVGPVVIASGPADVTVTEGQSATFNVVQVGGATFQWQQNSNNVAGATNSTYSIANVTPAMNNTKYRIIVTNPSGSVTSTNGTLRVISDTNAPTLVGAYANTNLIVASFSEPVTSVSANNTANYTVTNSSGQSFAITSAVLSTNGTNVSLNFASLTAGTYFLVVNNLRDTSAAANTIAPNSTVKVGFQAPVSDFASTWKYEQSNTDLGTAWSARTYNDTAWPSGQSLLGGKKGAFPATLPLPLRTTLDVTNSGSAGNDIPTHYFRLHFNSFSSGAGSISFRTVIDDGCVIYLNGEEIFRKNMPTGPILFSTLTLNGAAAPADGNDAPFIDGLISLPVANFLAGDNVIAVEVHQNSLASSDVYWAGEFSVLIDSGALQPGNSVQIVTQPRSRTNAVGSAASLYVVASGDPSLKYQWRTNGVNIPNQTNSTIILNPIQTANAGNYTVVVSNSFSGATSIVATVTVTNGGGACTYIAPAAPTLTNKLNGTNFILSWASAPVVTNSCGATSVFTLQSTLFLSNSPSATLWSNVTGTSPYTNPIPVGSASRYFRLVLP